MTEAYPLTWPSGWPRTPSALRDNYLAGTNTGIRRDGAA